MYFHSDRHHIVNCCYFSEMAEHEIQTDWLSEIGLQTQLQIQLAAAAGESREQLVEAAGESREQLVEAAGESIVQLAAVSKRFARAVFILILYNKSIKFLNYYRKKIFL